MSTEYFVLSDAQFALNPGQSKSFSFPLPGGAYVAGNQCPIVAFQVQPAPAPPNTSIEIKVDVNDQEQVTINLSRSHSGVFWEAVQRSARAGAQNTVQFRFVSGAGNVMFSDVIIWYQRP